MTPRTYRTTSGSYARYSSRIGDPIFDYEEPVLRAVEEVFPDAKSVTFCIKSILTIHFHEEKHLTPELWNILNEAMKANNVTINKRGYYVTIRNNPSGFLTEATADHFKTTFRWTRPQVDILSVAVDALAKVMKHPKIS